MLRRRLETALEPTQNTRVKIQAELTVAPAVSVHQLQRAGSAPIPGWESRPSAGWGSQVGRADLVRRRPCPVCIEPRRPSRAAASSLSSRTRAEGDVVVVVLPMVTTSTCGTSTTTVPKLNAKPCGENSLCAVNLGERGAGQYFLGLHRRRPLPRSRHRPQRPIRECETSGIGLREGKRLLHEEVTRQAREMVRRRVATALSGRLAVHERDGTRTFTALADERRVTDHDVRDGGGRQHGGRELARTCTSPRGLVTLSKRCRPAQVTGIESARNALDERCELSKCVLREPGGLGAVRAFEVPSGGPVDGRSELRACWLSVSEHCADRDRGEVAGRQVGQDPG